jgi:nicotinate dehydrogenase subunit B
MAANIEAQTEPAQSAAAQSVLGQGAITLGAQFYQGACAVCHQGGQRADVFGISSSLAFNTNLHSHSADNLVRIIMEGVATDRAGVHGAMPGFAAHLDDSQMIALLTYLRARFAPNQPMWFDVPATVARIRATR